MAGVGVLVGGPADGRVVAVAEDARFVVTLFTPGPMVVFGSPPARPRWWRHPVRWWRWRPVLVPEWPVPTEVSYRADGSVAAGRRVFRVAESWQPYRGVVAAGADPGALAVALSSAHPGVRRDPGTRWVMDAGWWHAVRRAAAQASFGWQDDDDPEPAEGDVLFGILVDVRAAGGAPHLESQRFPAGWPG